MSRTFQQIQPLDLLTVLFSIPRGKKWNPLRNRVDTYDSTVQQKFVGTLFLTILIFLYPTTLVYFAVFKVLELGLFAVNWSVSTAVSLVTHCGKQPDSGAATAIF